MSLVVVVVAVAEVLLGFVELLLDVPLEEALDRLEVAQGVASAHRVEQRGLLRAALLFSVDTVRIRLGNHSRSLTVLAFTLFND